MTPRTLKAVIEYDGTDYVGWQVQPNGPSIQAAVEAAIEKVTGERIRIHASGRTDAGVHAEGQVASFRLAATIPSATIPSDRLAAALNAHLPADIAVRLVTEAASDFHARFNARAKHYRYSILNRRARPALERLRVHHVVAPLDVAAMARAAGLLEGRHDFRAFQTHDPLRAGRDTVREMFAAKVRRRGDLVDCDFTGSGFLYNMARAMAGTLVEVGRGKFEPAVVGELLAAGDRRAAGPTLPARGLTLVRVDYQESAERGQDRDDDEDAAGQAAGKARKSC